MGAKPLSGQSTSLLRICEGYARAIHDQFVQHFSTETVFIDIDAIEPGLPFDEAIERAVGKCDILLAVIGLKECMSAHF